MKRYRNLIVGLSIGFILAGLISATVPASWVKQVFPFGIEIQGDLTVDSTIVFRERTAGTSDSVLVLEGGVIKL